MAAFNFFKIYPQQLTHLRTLLISKGIVLKETQQIQEHGISFTLELYFTENPIEKPIKWIKELKKIFSINDYAHQNYSAVVLITYNQTAYAITFGTSHFYVSKYSDFEFGINIASRILESYKIKNSRDFGGVRTKSIETYTVTDDLAFEAGEAVNYIRGIPINTELWGNTVSCGQSVQLRKRNLNIINVHTLCIALDDALTSDINKDIPKSIPVKDNDKTNQLNSQLIDDMVARNYMVSISQQQLSGVAFLFSDQYDFYISIHGETLPIDENLDLEQLSELVRIHLNNDYQLLLNSNIHVREENGQHVYSKKFINFIDYIDTNNNYYLEDGKWYQFDTNYLNNVKNEVNKITIDINNEIVRFDETTYQTWLTTQPSGQQHYRERYLNNLLETNYSYINHDREFQLFDGATIEITDLYKNNTIYIVKLGKPQTLNYAIDQATASLKFLERNSFVIPSNGQELPVKNICLWLFLDRVRPINQITEVNSLIFLMKLAIWRKTTLMTGLTPIIKISYK